MKSGKFFDALEKAINKYAEFETSIGTIRGGKITGFTHMRIKFNKSYVDIIDEIELNGDPSDRISVKELVRLELI